MVRRQIGSARKAGEGADAGLENVRSWAQNNLAPLKFSVERNEGKAIVLRVTGPNGVEHLFQSPAWSEVLRDAQKKIKTFVV